MRVQCTIYVFLVISTRVSYIKAIDVWMSMNLVFVFTAYMEYAVVTVVARKYKRMLRKKEKKESEALDDKVEICCLANRLLTFSLDA